MVRGHRGFIGAGVVALVAGGISTISPTPVRAIAPATPVNVTFSVPTLADAVHTYGEPDINLDQKNTVEVSGPTGTGTQRSMWSTSFDGQAYRQVNQNAAVGNGPVFGVNDPPGGGDTEIVFDNGTLAGHAVQTQYFSDLYALLCFRVESTSDNGAHNQQNSVPGTAGCSTQQPTADRQWQVVFDPPSGVASTSPNVVKPTVYLTYNAGGAAWNKSPDGLHFTPADGATPATPNLHSGNDGYPAIDQLTGKVFESAGDGAGNVKLNIGTPVDAAGDLCFLDDTATSNALCQAGSGLVTVASGLTGDPNSHFPVTSMDKARNLYVSWNQINSGDPTKDQVFIAAAPPNGTRNNQPCTDCWTNWTTPIQVSDGSASTGDAVNSFSWSTVGGQNGVGGVADVAWYGSNKTDDPNVNNCGSNKATFNDPNCEVWNLFFNQVKFQTDPVTGAVTGAPLSATPIPVKAAPHPMHYGDICGAGTGCIIQQGNRNLADFFMVRTDSTGAAEIVYTDTSNGLITGGTQPSNVEGDADHLGAPVVTVIRQNSGLGTNNVAVPSSPPNAPAPVPTVAPTDHLDGAKDNALFDPTTGAVAGTNLPGMDLTRSQLSMSGSTLTVTMKVANLNDMTVGTTAPGTTLQQYVTRWVMATSNPQKPYQIFYAGMSCAVASCALAQSFYAGPAQSTDLCSVSACFPHVTLYPESTAVGTPAAGIVSGSPEAGGISCPATPSSATPCTITIQVNAADVGGVTPSSLLEEVGAYSFVASHPQAATTVPQAQADSVQLMVDGVCCYNFQAVPPANVAETPWTPALLAIGAVLITTGAVRRRRFVQRSATRD